MARGLSPPTASGLSLGTGGPTPPALAVSSCQSACGTAGPHVQRVKDRPPSLSHRLPLGDSLPPSSHFCWHSTPGQACCWGRPARQVNEGLSRPGEQLSPGEHGSKRGMSCQHGGRTRLKPEGDGDTCSGDCAGHFRGKRKGKSRRGKAEFSISSSRKLPQIAPTGPTVINDTWLENER